MKLMVWGIFTIVMVGLGWYWWGMNPQMEERVEEVMNEGGLEISVHPLSIESLRRGEYPGSELVVEQRLEPVVNYERAIVSYRSEGLKIFALLTVPSGTPPQQGWPVVVFNHGYISPSVYKTTERYVAYQDAFARNGFVTLKSDYRGHGNSEGEARGGYGVNDYTIDVLNAVASIKQYEGIDPERIGMWGHSMGGHITLESMVVNKDIKAGVIWAGVVGSYEELIDGWRRGTSGPRVSPSPGGRGWWRQQLVQEFGDHRDNPEFWASLSATSYLKEISGPLQLHHGTEDSSVDVRLSENLEKRMREAGVAVEAFYYQGDDHNLSGNLNLALERSVMFFDKYLKD